MSLPCQNEKTIDLINDKVDRLENKIDKLEAKIDALMEYRYRQQGAFKVLITIGSMIGAVFGFIAERLIR
jgi:uncharacterized protein YigA (DUF484 family)